MPEQKNRIDLFFQSCIRLKCISMLTHTHPHTYVHKHGRKLDFCSHGWWKAFTVIILNLALDKHAHKLIRRMWMGQGRRPRHSRRVKQAHLHAPSHTHSIHL